VLIALSFREWREFGAVAAEPAGIAAVRS
jgi:hypothetical protein